MERKKKNTENGHKNTQISIITLAMSQLGKIAYKKSQDWKMRFTENSGYYHNHTVTKSITSIKRLKERTEI